MDGRRQPVAVMLSVVMEMVLEVGGKLQVHGVECIFPMPAAHLPFSLFAFGSRNTRAALN